MSRSAPIMVADDEESDLVLFRLALEEVGVGIPLITFTDGKETIEYLNGDAPYGDRSEHPIPRLLLLDLKMPRKTGFDVLAWLGKQPTLKCLPVVVFSSSGEDCDREKAFQLGASDYRVKGQNFSQLVQTVRDIYARWVGAEP